MLAGAGLTKSISQTPDWPAPTETVQGVYPVPVTGSGPRASSERLLIRPAAAQVPAVPSGRR